MEIDIFFEDTPEEIMFQIMKSMYVSDTFERKNPDIIPINYEILSEIIEYEERQQ